MNAKFVPPMTRKYNTALSVNAKLLNMEDLSLHSRKLNIMTISTCDGDKYPSKYLF